MNKEKPTNTPVTEPISPRTSPLAGTVIAENFAGWSAEIRQEFADNAHNHQVGSVLRLATLTHHFRRQFDDQSNPRAVDCW
jgi:hypothetical protein